MGGFSLSVQEPPSVRAERIVGGWVKPHLNRFPMVSNEIAKLYCLSAFAGRI
jgi:hypothetical protein